MKKDKLKPIVISVGLLVFAFSLLWLDSFVNKTRTVDPVEIHRKGQIDTGDKYNQYGLEKGQALAQNPFKEDDNYIFYKDRILKKFSYKSENIKNGEIILDYLTQIIPKSTNIYMIPIPERIIWEDNHKAQTREYRNFLLELYDIIPEDVTLLDPLQILWDHSDEYLFFRTDDSITSKGAYYTTKLLYENMGLTPITLDEYDEYQYSSFQGINKAFTKLSYDTNIEMLDKINAIPNDLTYHYLIPGGKNRAIRTKIDRGNVVTENVVLVAKTRLGGKAIIGNSFYWAVAEGEGKSAEKKDKTALLLFDTSGNMLVPFLTPYYEKVYLVNLTYHEYNEEKFKKIFSEYDISDIIIAQKSGAIGDILKSKFFTGVFNEGNK